MATNERDAREVSYRVEEFIGILGTDKRGWTKELNVVRWNRAEPKYDIRDWNPEHDQMARGVTLRREEMAKLRDLVRDLRIPGCDEPAEEET